MQALVIIDAQNEFTSAGQRPVQGIDNNLQTISDLVNAARKNKTPIAWVRHFNKPHESPAFVPGTWGSEFITGFGPQQGFGEEGEFHKEVYGAFTGTNIRTWLENMGAEQVMIVGFYTHGCVSTTAREALMAGYEVALHANATGTCELKDEVLGRLTAEEVHRSALLHLSAMGANIIKN